MLHSLILGYYRAYGEPQRLDFVRPTGNCLGLNIILGENNAGKSTVLNVISELFHQSSEFIVDSMSQVDDQDVEISLKMSFENSEENLVCQKMAGGFFNKVVLGKDISQSDQRRNALRRRVRLLPSKRNWSDRFNRTAKQGLAQLEEQLYNTARNQEAQLGSLLAEIIRNGQKAKFDRVLKRVIPEITDWRINRFLDTDYIEYVNKSGRAHALAMLGDGLSSVFRLAYTLFSSNAGDVIILDEPERSLHPDAQKSLYALLSELAEDRQILVATHSPYLVNWEGLSGGARVFRCSLNQNGSSEVHALDQSIVDDIVRLVENDFMNRKLFDILAKETFFRRSVLFCEGQEDVHYLENYFRYSGEKAIPLFAYGVGGAPNIQRWVPLARSLGIRAAALFDANESRLADELRELYANDDCVRVWTLPADDIRDKPDVVRGIFAQNGSLNEEFRADFVRIIGEIQSWLNK